MGYDYGTYKGQLQNKKSLAPVITIVLNFDEKRWNKPKSIWEQIKIPDEMKQYVQDYRVEVFDIAYLEDEIIDAFSSDFKLVARFFKERRLNPKGCILTDGTTEIRHVEAVLKFLEAFTKDAKYGEVYRKILKPL